jgi:autotransporter-associated beta strand protein
MFLNGVRRVANRVSRKSARSRGTAVRGKYAFLPQLEALEVRLAPATHTWNGQGVTRNWTDIQNWDNGSAPVNDPQADLVFPAGVFNRTSNDDFPNPITIRSIEFDDVGYVLGVKTGTSGVITLTDSIRQAGSVQAGGNSIALNTIILDAGSGHLFDVERSVLNVFSEIDSNGISRLIKVGLGNLMLGKRNFYFGETSIDEGTVTANADNVIPGLSPVTVSGAATLDLNGHSSLMGSLAGSGSLLLGNSTVSVGFDQRSTAFSGVVSGSGRLVKVGTGVLTLAGLNSYMGGTSIEGGTLQLGRDFTLTGSVQLKNRFSTLDLDGYHAFLGSLTGDPDTQVRLGGGLLNVNFTGGSTFSGVITGRGGITKDGAGTWTLGGPNSYSGALDVEGGVVQLAADNAIPLTSALVLEGPNTRFDLGNFSDTIGSLSGAGTVLLRFNHELRTRMDAFSGVLLGDPVSLVSAVGSITGDSSNNPPLSVQSAPLVLDGKLSSTRGVTVLTDGTLRGHGTVGPITVNAKGAVSPGDDASPGTLTTGNAIFKADSTFRVRLNGIRSGMDADQLNVIGTADLTANPALNLTLGYDYVAGNTVTLLKTTGGVHGTFKDLPDGKLVKVNRAVFRINYTANNVMLTAIDPALVPAAVPLAATQGQAFNGVLASFTDPRGDGTTMHYTATITWGDGSPNSTGTVATNTHEGFDVKASHTYAHEGPFTFMVHISADDGRTATATAEIHVARTAAAPRNLLDAANALTHSQEYFIKLVTATYQRYLGRLPEQGGLMGWVQALQSGLTDEQLEAAFIGSAEYIQNHGGTSEAWVRGLYHDLLGRDPDAAGLNFWLDALQRGASPSGIAYGFAASAEREAQRITADYHQYLDRDPEPGIVAVWVNAFQNGARNEDVIAGFVGSGEYFRRKFNNVRDWLFSAYRDILSRPADDAGTITWLGILGQL